MPGTPLKRARKEKAALAAGVLPPLPTAPGIPDATSVQRTNPRAGARVREPRMPIPATTRAPQLGTATRAVIDDQSARAVRSLANTIRPGMRLRLSRTRPTWAAGFLEDYPVSEGDNLATFFEHVRDEYGGQSYTVEVLAAGDVQAFEGALAIAGPPLERGRPINRNKWEGRDDDDEPKRSRVAVAPAASAFNFEGVVSLATLVLGVFQKHQSEQMSSVKEMVVQSRELVVAALGQRDKQETKTSFAAQLGEIVEATRGIEKVKKALGGTNTREQAADDDDDTAMLTKAAKKMFFEGVAGSFVKKVLPTDGQPGAPAPRRAQRPAPASQTRGVPQGFIPDARSAGHAPPKN